MYIVALAKARIQIDGSFKMESCVCQVDFAGAGAGGGRGGVIVFPIRNRGQAQRPRTILDQEIDRRGQHDAHDPGDGKTGAPAKIGHHRGGGDKGQTLRPPDARCSRCRRNGRVPCC